MLRPLASRLRTSGRELREHSLPNSVFAYEFGDISPEQQAGFARQYGFEGTVFDHALQIPERLRALDEAHLQLFFLWLTVDISNGQTKYEPGMEAAIEALKGRGTVVWVAIQGDHAGGGAGAEERTIEAVDRISDLAARSNLRVALYPALWLLSGPVQRRCADCRTSPDVAMWAPRSICAMNCAPGLIPSFISCWIRRFHGCIGVTVNGADRPRPGLEHAHSASRPRRLRCRRVGPHLLQKPGTEGRSRHPVLWIER